ncbi:MAG: tyrosine-type recombinase/integrase [Phocaeicola sp.]|nr:tyrosine-type recombinase/integrase [Phocaeicola sp.]
MLIESFLNYLKLERNYSDKTILSYGKDLEQFEKFLKKLDEKIKLETVDADLIRSWVIDLMDEKMAASSVNRKLSSLRSFYRYLLRKGLVQVDPVRKVTGPKKKKPLPTFVKEEDMNKLLDEVPFGDDFEGVRDKLILEVFYVTGVRRSELVALNDADIDYSASTIKVTGKRNKQRLIPFGERLKGMLSTYQQLRDEMIPQRSEAFFVQKNGERVTAGLVYNMVKRDLSKVVTLKKRSPHVLRHSFATNMLNNRASLGAVKELLGHERLTTTEIYTHTTFEELKKEYEHAHPRA